MESKEAIEFLDNLKEREICTVNIPLYRNSVKMPVTVVYLGKDRNGNYKFGGSRSLTVRKERIEDGSISIDKNFDISKDFTLCRLRYMQSKRNKSIER